MNLDYINHRMMSAVRSIGDGSRAKLADLVPIQGTVGRKVRIKKALQEGAGLLREPFHDEHWTLVENAFSRFGTKPLSRQKDECCRELLKLLSNEDVR